MYIPYFQAGTNTYAPVSRLRELYEEALSIEGAVGLTVATRADCISDDVLQYLTELSGRTYLTVELGLQTIHDRTASAINRCHTYDEFVRTYETLKKAGINICVHIINGLPDETEDMMIHTAEQVSRLKPHSVKIHMLHIIRETQLARIYEKEPFYLLTRDEYIDIVCNQIEIMHPDIIIERVTGDGDRKNLIAPLWTGDKKSVINGIDKELRRRNSVQGQKSS
jgi:radical SAM protein (TIGR01212 family)